MDRSADMKYNGVIAISGINNPKSDTHNDISVVFLTFWCDVGRRGNPLSAVRAADVKYFDIIEITGPNSPKIDAHNDISVVFLRFYYDGGRRATLYGRRVSLGWRAGGRT